MNVFTLGAQVLAREHEREQAVAREQAHAQDLARAQAKTQELVLELAQEREQARVRDHELALAQAHSQELKRVPAQPRCVSPTCTLVVGTGGAVDTSDPDCCVPAWLGDLSYSSSRHSCSPWASQGLNLLLLLLRTEHCRRQLLPSHAPIAGLWAPPWVSSPNLQPSRSVKSSQHWGCWVYGRVCG